MELMRLTCLDSRRESRNEPATKFLMQQRDCPANTQNPALTDPTVLANLNGESALRLVAGLLQYGNNQSEDCLTLNIWTKPQVGENAKAVLIWIYGGG
jgi:cholinesterase